MLKEVALSGCACILSIHQSSTRLFNMFDDVLLLTRGGKLAYFGPPQQVVHHFTTLGHVIPPHLTPAEYLLELASQRNSSFINDLCAGYTTSIYRHRVEEDIQHYRNEQLLHIEPTSSLGFDMSNPFRRRQRSEAEKSQLGKHKQLML